MLDGLLGRGFSSKCKSLIKMTKSRIDVIRRKRNATLKFLKKDMADLLANGLDINGYGRAEGLLAELTLLSCYDLVEQYSDFILKHLSVMQKMSHCPEDCREAVSSLMFAAARFSDLPELRDLRQIFFERYGTSVELFANQKFLENLSSKPFTTEQKVRLMQDTASQFSIKWDSRGFEQRMCRPPTAAQGKQEIYRSLHANDDKHMSVNDKGTKGDKYEVLSKEMFEHTNVSQRLLANKEDNFARGNKLYLQPINGVPSNGYKATSFREEDMLYRDNQEAKQEATLQKHESRTEDTPLKAVILGSSSQRKKMENINCRSKLPDSGENTVLRIDSQDVFAGGNPDTAPNCGGLLLKNDCNNSMSGNSYGGHRNIANLRRDFPEEDAHKLQSHYKNFIPPYTKPNLKPKDEKYGANIGSSHTGSENVVFSDPFENNRATAGNWSQKIQNGAHHPDHEKPGVGPTAAKDYGHNINYYQDEWTSNPMSKLKSSRRKHSKSRSSRNDVGNLEDAGVAKRSSRSRRRDDSRRGLQTLFDDEQKQVDEEEMMIDKLLIQYSKKPSAYKADKVQRKPKSHPGHHIGTEVDKCPRNISGEGPDETWDRVPPPPRSISLPREQTASEAAKVVTRAASFQPDRSSPARHVHPKLPDYDDLAARFAALKGW